MQDYLISQAGIFDSVFGLFGDTAFETIGSIVLLLVGFLASRYLVPLLKTELARQTAHHLLVVADDVTDYFDEKFPNAHWSVWLDRAVDKIIDVTGVGRETADRVARACVNRKKERLATARAANMKGRS